MIFRFLFDRYDHQERLTAQEAMAHGYFAPIRAAEAASTTANNTATKQENVYLIDSD